MLDCGELIRATVRPFLDGRYVEDWQRRAARASALSDYYTIRLRGSPFFELEDAALGGPFGSGAPLRSALRGALAPALSQETIGYDFACQALPPHEAGVFGRLYQDVDSVEKMALSGLAHAICRLSPPLGVALSLANLFADEALHLFAFSTLLALPQAERPWITAKREPFWRLLAASDDLVSFLFFQNCLSETEGCLSAADSAVRLMEAGVGGVAARVAYRILVEETNHALTGYTLLKQVDTGLEERRFEELTERYLGVEQPVAPDTRKGQRQRFALDVAGRYVRTRDVAAVHARILEAVQAPARRLAQGGVQA